MTLLEQIVVIIIAVLGVPLIYYQVKTLFKPDRVGRIIEFENVAKKCLDRCNGLTELMHGRRMSIGVVVELVDGGKIVGEISPCSICLEKMKVGDWVGVSKVGSRYVVQPYFGRKPVVEKWS